MKIVPSKASIHVSSELCRGVHDPVTPMACPHPNLPALSQLAVSIDLGYRRRSPRGEALPRPATTRGTNRITCKADA